MGFLTATDAPRVGWIGTIARPIADLAAITCALTIVVGFLGWVAPTIDRLNHFQPVWTALACAGVVVAVIGGGRARVRRSGLLALISLYLLLSPVLRLNGSSHAAGDGVALKVLTFNVHWSHPNPAAIVDFIRAEDPDLVLLQEVSRRTERVVNEDLRAFYPHRRFCIDLAGCDSAILSKWPILENRQFHRLADAPPAISAIIELGGGTRLRVVGIHVMNPHDPGRQAREIEWLSNHVRAAREPTLVAGDLNLTPWTSALHRLERQTGLVRATGLAGTWPATSRYIPPIFPIDHVLAPAGSRLVDVRRGPKLGSDHLPVIATLVIPRR